MSGESDRRKGAQTDGATDHQADLDNATGPEGRETTPESGDETAFDQWLKRGLRDLYSPVLNEPVPDDLVELIQAHRRKKSSGR